MQFLKSFDFFLQKIDLSRLLSLKILRGLRSEDKFVRESDKVFETIRLIAKDAIYSRLPRTNGCISGCQAVKIFVFGHYDEYEYKCQR